MEILFMVFMVIVSIMALFAVMVVFRDVVREILEGRREKRNANKTEETEVCEAPVEEAPAPAPVAAPAPTAPGSAGKLKLHDVEPKTAAMIMAIVADKMGKPINELRFISIKEVK